MAIDFPASPTNGQVFVNGNVKYTWDSAMARWASAPLGTALPFNYFVNGSASVSQQNGRTTGSTINGYYPADQWKWEFVHASGKTGFSISSQASFVTPLGSSCSLRIYVSSTM